MRLIPRFVKATIVGGLLFVIPLILMGLVLRRGLDIVAKIVDPLAARFPDHRILGIALTTILSAVVIVISSFVLGLVAQTAMGRRVREWLEWTILGKVPGYAMIKGVLQGSTGLEESRRSRSSSRGSRMPGSSRFSSRGTRTASAPFTCRERRARRPGRCTSCRPTAFGRPTFRWPKPC